MVLLTSLPLALSRLRQDHVEVLQYVPDVQGRPRTEDEATGLVVIAGVSTECKEENELRDVHE